MPAKIALHMGTSAYPDLQKGIEFVALFLVYSFSIYLIGSFIAWDFNVANWKTAGRIIAALSLMFLMWRAYDKEVHMIFGPVIRYEI